MRRRQLVPILAWSIAFAVACGHESGPAPAAPDPKPLPLAVEPPPEVAAHLGEGPLAVYGANVYSPGQEIYKALRQEDSLMAFLACQGEPDRVEVRENESPGAAPLIFLEYTRRGLAQHGTVELEPNRSGYYMAHPIDPSSRLKSAKPAEPVHPRQPAPKPKPAPKPTTPSPEPEPELEPAAPVEPAEAAPAIPEPTPAQQDECPIEPWRSDCRKLCVPGAEFEWCSYRD